MKFSGIQIGDMVEVYKGMEWGLVKVVGKSSPQTIIVEEQRGARHFVNSGNIKPKRVEPLIGAEIKEG